MDTCQVAECATIEPDRGCLFRQITIWPSESGAGSWRAVPKSELAEALTRDALEQAVAGRGREGRKLSQQVHRSVVVAGVAALPGRGRARLRTMDVAGVREGMAFEYRFRQSLRIRGALPLARGSNEGERDASTAFGPTRGRGRFIRRNGSGDQDARHAVRRCCGEHGPVREARGREDSDIACSSSGQRPEATCHELVRRTLHGHNWGDGGTGAGCRWRQTWRERVMRPRLRSTRRKRARTGSAPEFGEAPVRGGEIEREWSAQLRGGLEERLAADYDAVHVVAEGRSTRG